jgi:hypothetical protein
MVIHPRTCYNFISLIAFVFSLEVNVPRLTKTILLAALSILLATAPTLQALAQSTWDIRISQVTTLETPDAMVLKVYFNIFDPKTSLPILDAVAKSAQIDMPQSNFSTEAQFKKPDVPIYVVMVLDASGSMGGAADDLRKAAKLALSNTPDNSYFSVVQFDETIKLIQDFTENISAVSYAIDQYTVSNKGTCLYDATYSAIEGLAKAPVGRRAIIVFTDGRDEDKAGKVCSKHTYQELVDLAMQSQIPINTIGLSYKEGNVNEVELNGMAASTGGFSAIARQSDMSAAFEQIMDVLKSQWMVETSIYPRRGTNQILMTLKMKDDQTLSASFPVNSNTDYPGPPSPVTAQIAGLQLNAAKQAYEVQLNLTSPELVSYVKISIWDTNAGSKTGEYVFDNPSANNTFSIPTEALIMSRSYELRITAVNKADGSPFDIVRDSNGKPSQELLHQFVFDPSSAYPNLQVQSVTELNGDLVLNISVTNPGLIGGFDGWLVDEATNTQVAGSNFTNPPITTTTGSITLSMRTSNIPDGKYTVVVRVLAKNNNVYSTTTYAGVAYDAPTFFQRLGVALIAAPIFLFAILAIILGVIAFLMFNSSRQKAMSGTPVMQGQLGGKLRGAGKKSGPIIPVADDEPIFSNRGIASARNAPPAPPPPADLSQPQPVSSSPAGATLLAGEAPLEGATVIASAPSAFIVIIKAPDANLVQKSIPVSQFPFVIGRQDGTLIIKDQNISRKHAQITFDEVRRAYFLADLNSSNGTFLNDRRLSPNQPVQLTGGAVFRLGPGIIVRFDIR